jgi:hypothetical protein
MSSKQPSMENPPESSEAVHEAELAEELNGIYGDDVAAGPRDMTRLDQADHSVLKRVLVGTIAFFSILATISWAGFFFFSPGRERFVGENVTVAVEGPAEAKSGEVVTYAVRWKNEERVPIGTASLEVRMPKDFTITKSEPQPQEGRWLIGSVSPGADGMITIEGVYLAPVDKVMDVQAILSYRPADFNSEFQKVETKSVRITDSVLGLTVTGPAKILPGDKVTLLLDYSNESQNEFRDLRVRGAWPSDFIPESSEPAALDAQNREWVIGNLAPGTKGTIKVIGTFASGTEGAMDLKAQIGFLNEDEAFQLQKEGSFGTTVLRGDLLTALILNGKSGDQSVRFGDRLRFAVSYKNTGTAALEDVTLALAIEPTADEMLMWNDLIDRAKGARSGNVITWDKTQIPSLAKIAGGEEGTLDLEVPLIASPLAVAPQDGYAITSSLEVMVKRIDGAKVDRAAKTQPIISKLLSDTGFSSSGRYFSQDNVPVGSGPLPPEVGKDTVYRIHWRISNTLHEIGDLRLSAKLPANAEWTGNSSVDAGELRFDAASEKMIWTLNWLPTSIKTLDISFDVRLTPNEGDSGRIPTLVDAAIFEAFDRDAGFPLLLSAPPVTTALEGDEFASGKGRVQ